MAKQYDATLKQLVEAHPADWLALAGFPAGGDVRLVDADVSAVTAAADKVIRADGPPPYIGHAEFQAGPDAGLDFRVLLYQVLLRSRHHPLPVRSVAFLLHPRAATGVIGRVRHETGPEEWLDFSYRVVRVWELPVGQLLEGGLGTLPLAPISAVAADELHGVVERMQERFAAALSPADTDVAWTAAYLLAGLRHEKRSLERLLEGVWNMEESVTYQAMMERGVARGIERGRTEGRTEGRAEEARALVLLLAGERFGAPDAAARARLDAITDLGRLEATARRVLTASDWHDLLTADN